MLPLFSQLDTARHCDWSPEPPPSLDGIKDIELDCETDGLRWWAGDRPLGMGLRLPSGKTQYLPWGHRGGGNLDESSVKEWARRELRGKRITNLNTRFDVHMLREWGVDLEAQGCEVSDVGHYAALLDDHRQRFSLDALSQDYLGKRKVGMELDTTRMADYHAGEVAPRALGDVQLVHELKQAMWPLLTEQNLQEVRQLEDEVIYPVCEMERNGAPINVELLHQWDKASQQDHLRCLWEIYRETGLNINPDSPKDLEKLFQHLKLNISTTTTGRSSFTGAILKAIDDPVIKLVVKATKLSELRSRYLNKYTKAISSDGILRYALHQLRAQKDEFDLGAGAGTVSGRFSSTEIVKGEGINIQQVMKVAKQLLAYGEDYLVRQLFRPASGLWLSADAQQIEYRLFASYANSPRVIQAYKDNPNLSFHKFIWEMIKKFKPDITYRQQKDLNFAKIYGAGLLKMALMLEFITAQEYSRFRIMMDQGKYRDVIEHPKMRPVVEVNDIYNRELPEVAPLLERAKTLAEKRGYVHTVLGRRSRFFEGERSHKALNAVIQGSAADINKRKLVELHRAKSYTQFTMRYTVHDEVDGDIPDQEHARRVAEVLDAQSFPSVRIPILWDVTTGGNWRECAEDWQEGHAA